MDFGALFMAGLLVAAGAPLVHSYRQRRQIAAEAAAELGLWVRLDLSLHGPVDGVEIVLESLNATTRCRARLPFSLPDGLVVRTRRGLDPLGDLLRGTDVQLGNSLDPTLDIRGPVADTRALCTEPGVDAALRAAVEHHQLWAGQDLIELRQAGSHLDGSVATVRATLALAFAIRAAWVAPWEAVRDRWDLREEGGDLRRRLVGTADGVPIVVQQHRPEDDALYLRVTAQLSRPLPPGTTLSHPDVGFGRSLPLADPILEGRIHARSDDARALAARVCRDAVRGPLLEVVRAHPGSWVTADRIGLMVKSTVLDPLPMVVLVLELEHVLCGNVA